MGPHSADGTDRAVPKPLPSLLSLVRSSEPHTVRSLFGFRAFESFGLGATAWAVKELRGTFGGVQGRTSAWMAVNCRGLKASRGPGVHFFLASMVGTFLSFDEV